MGGTRTAYWSPYAPFQPLKNKNDTGGGFSRIPITLQLLWDWHSMSWNSWSRATDGFNLVRFKKAKLKFYPHEEHDYIVHWETDFWKSNVYAWPFYHPALMLQKKNHVVVQSKNQKPNGRAVRVTLRPPALETNGWYFMAQYANDAMVLLQSALIDLADPFMTPNDVTGPFQLKWQTKPSGLSDQAGYYWWLWDTGDLNGYVVQPTAPGPGNYANALGKGVPFWQSLWGLWGNPNVWIWYDTSGMEVGTGARDWGRLHIESLNKIIQSGPYVEKTNNAVFSVAMSYKFYFQFGGPTITDGLVAGTSPDAIPPGWRPRDFSAGVQVGDLAEHSLGVAMPWDYRRGLLTPRGLQRLTKSLSVTELPQRSAQEETEQELSEEDSSSSEEEEEEEERNQHLLGLLGELGQQQLLVHQTRL